MKDQYVRFFDTTLRDGEQSPGASLTSTEKLEIARALARLGVDVIEAGFPAASPDDFQGVQRIAKDVGVSKSAEGRTPSVCGLARALRGDIDTAWEAVKPAEKPRIHTFLATSPVHMKYKLDMTPEEVVFQVGEMVTYARSLCEDVEFSPEDAARSDPEFLYKVLEQAIKAGASTLNIPDTVGYATPEEFKDLIAGIIANTPGIEKAVLSVHCHDDLGLASANTLAGIQAGARQVEVTMNGIGERAGNTSLEEIVMALFTRQGVYQLETGIDTTQISRVSRLVSNYTGIPIQPNKAIVGENAFAHEAGIHQDGMLKHNNTYEIMLPETVGLNRSRLVLGKHSGRHALQVRLDELGFSLSKEELAEIFKSFKLLADKKKTITDADLEALVEDWVYRAEEIFSLDGLQVACGTMGLPTATVRLRDQDGELHIQASVGTGPVDAAYKAVDGIIQVPNTLLEFSINAVTEGIDAIGEVTVRLEPKNGSIPQRTSPQSGLTHPRSFGGYGADTDIIVACVKAYLSGLNKLLNAREFIQQAELGSARFKQAELPNEPA
jgi:2-isopropylmalate synthase